MTLVLRNSVYAFMSLALLALALAIECPRPLDRRGGRRYKNNSPVTERWSRHQRTWFNIRFNAFNLRRPSKSTEGDSIVGQEWR